MMCCKKNPIIRNLIEFPFFNISLRTKCYMQQQQKSLVKLKISLTNFFKQIIEIKELFSS